MSKRPRYPTREEAALSTPVRIARKMMKVEEEYERRAREWSRAGKTITPEKLRAMKDVAARRVLELDRETFDAWSGDATPSKRRALRRKAQRKPPMSLREAARSMGVDASKSTRFVARFIDTGRLAFERVGSRWVFDFNEFERVRQEEKAKVSTDGRRKRAR